MPGIKFKLTLNKVIEVDTDRDWGGDLEPLIEALKNNDVEPGNTANEAEIHDAIKSMLEDDIETVADVSLDENDFEIEVPAGTKVEMPEEEAEED